MNKQRINDIKRVFFEVELCDLLDILLQNKIINKKQYNLFYNDRFKIISEAITNE